MAGSLWFFMLAVQASQASEDGSGAGLHGYLAFGLLTAVVLTAAVFDWRTGRIPNLLLGPAIAAGFVLAAAMGFAEAGHIGLFNGLKNAGIAMLAGFIPAFLIFMAGALGGGDVKLFAAIGAIAANWEVVLGAAFYGFIGAALIAVIIMVRRRIVGNTLRRIANAALMAAAKVKPDLQGEGSVQIALAVPVSIGAILAGIELLLKVRMPWTMA